MEICIKWKMCRTCTGDRIAQLQPIFKDTSIAQQLEEYAGILVKPDDGLPDKICLDCIETLQSVHAFLTCCRRSDAHLRNVVRRTMASGKCFPSSSMDQSVFSCSLSKLEAQHSRKRKQNKNARILEQKKKLKSEDGKSLFTEKEISNPDAIKAHEQTDIESKNSPGKEDSLPDSIKCEKNVEINKSSTTTKNNEDCLFETNLTESEIDTDSEDNEYSINNEDYENEYTEPDYSIAVAAAKESLFQISTQSVNTQTDCEEKPVLKVEEPTSTDTSMTMVDLAAACEPSSFPRHSCAICGNSFPNHAQLKSHLRTHRNEKNYECELCSKRFNAACNLTTHMRTHTGEKPFACSHCGRRFADRSTHRKHERMHTNERPYACNLCPKTFSLSTTLKAHFLSHSKEKPHKCVTCNKGFRLPHQLKAHERTHVHRYEVGITLYNQDEGDNSSS